MFQRLHASFEASELFCDDILQGSAFYQGLSKGASKDVALQKAMEKVRNNQKWRHPFFWSPFFTWVVGIDVTAGEESRDT